MLTDAFLNRLDALRLAMRGRAQGGAGGSRRSRQTGSSAEFSDYREYIPGDDIRRLDWNAYARFDRLFLKLFMEEQESQVTVLLDASASMEAKWTAAYRPRRPAPCRASPAAGCPAGSEMRLSASYFSCTASRMSASTDSMSLPAVTASKFSAARCRRQAGAANRISS